MSLGATKTREKQMKFVGNCNLFFLLALLFNLKFPELFPATISLFKVNNKNTRKKCEICSKLTIKTTERDLMLSLNK